MEQVEKLLFSLIKYSVSKSSEVPTIVSGEELEQVCKLAASHDMIHLVGDALLRLGITKKSPALTEILEKERLKAVYRAERLENELSSLCSLLEEEKIDHVPLKGAVIRGLYPETWMRTSSDIDILVKTEDTERVSSLIQERLSYRFDGNTKHDLEFFSPSGLHFELHFLLCEGDPSIDRVLEGVWDQVKGGFKKEMTPEMFLFYHIAHMAKHTENGGCGIRPFLDLWILENTAVFAEASTHTLINNSKLKCFYEVAHNLTSAWFDGTQLSETAESLGKYTLGAGVYGNLENMVASGQTKKGGKIGYALSRIFLPYETLKVHYPILEKHKWLFPLCQIRRWFKLLFCGGVKRSVKELKTNSSISDEKEKNTESLFKALGLRD